MVFMNVRCNWNEQMLQYCSAVFNNRLLTPFFSSALSFQSPPFPFSFPSAGPSFFLAAVLFSRSVPAVRRPQTLCCALWMC